jgi:hypothetical protein
MSNHQHPPFGSPSIIDTRLRRLFRSLDTSPGFEARVLEKLRAQAHSAAVQSSAAVSREEQLYRETMDALRRWRQVAMRSVTRVALAAGSLVILLTAGLMRSLPVLHEWIQSASPASTSSVQWLVTLLGAAVGLAPLVVPRFKRH